MIHPAFLLIMSYCRWIMLVLREHIRMFVTMIQKMITTKMIIRGIYGRARSLKMLGCVFALFRRMNLPV